MEIRVEVEENKLEKAEKHIYQILDLDITQNETLVLCPFQGPEKDEDESSGQSSLVSETVDELAYDGYLRRLGNQDILRENYEELLNEKAMLEAEQEIRQLLGIDLDPKGLEFLAKFEETIEPVRRVLEEVSEDVERLKRLCIENGLIGAARSSMGNQLGWSMKSLN